MELTQEERARITDSTHKIQSANDSLAHVDPSKIPEIDEIQECLENADKTLRGVLRSPQAGSIKPPSDKKKPS
jgi:hypothetical protein